MITFGDLLDENDGIHKLIISLEAFDHRPIFAWGVFHLFKGEEEGAILIKTYNEPSLCNFFSPFDTYETKVDAKAFTAYMIRGYNEPPCHIFTCQQAAACYVSNEIHDILHDNDLNLMVNLKVLGVLPKAYKKLTCGLASYAPRDILHLESWNGEEIKTFGTHMQDFTNLWWIKSPTSLKINKNTFLTKQRFSNGSVILDIQHLSGMAEGKNLTPNHKDTYAYDQSDPIRGMVFSDPLVALLYTSALILQRKKSVKKHYQDCLFQLNHLVQDI